MNIAHPAPDAPVQPYDDRLSRLLGHLTNAVATAGLAPGQFTHAALTHHGIRVSLMVREDHRRVVCIAREDRPDKGNLKAWDRHHENVRLTRLHMGIEDWTDIAPEQLQSGMGCTAWYVEPSTLTDEKGALK